MTIAFQALERTVRQALATLREAPQPALEAAQRALAARPDNPVALRQRAIARRALGDPAGASRDEVAAVQLSAHSEPLRAAARALVERRLDEAERGFEQRLTEQPLDVAAMQMLAEVLVEKEQLSGAVAVLRLAADIAPGYWPAKQMLARQLLRLGKASDALALFEAWGKESPLPTGAEALKAAALDRLGRFDEAIALYRQMLDRAPASAELWVSLATVLKTIGERDGCEAACRRAIALRPTFGRAWWTLADLKTGALDETDGGALQQALADPKVGNEDRLHLHFALGRYFSERGDPKASWTHYAEGNRMRRATLPFDADDVSRFVDRAIGLFSDAFFAARAGQGDPAPDPIFIVGMPRAGSTLIEQILASHSQVEGTMELPDLMALGRQLGADGSGAPYPLQLETLDPDALAELGRSYLRSTAVYRDGTRPFFIDKNPNNWIHVGLIRLILPAARIIDARREPLDCGLSNFRQLFGSGQPFSYDLGEFGRYYADYVRLMDHFDRVQPNAVHRVIHEQLVADPEGEVRRLLDYCKLSFEEDCLRFHESRRPVRTASAEQVRQPLSDRGIGQWKAFADHLGPLRDALGPTLERWRGEPRPARKPAKRGGK